MTLLFFSTSFPKTVQKEIKSKRTRTRVNLKKTEPKQRIRLTEFLVIFFCLRVRFPSLPQDVLHYCWSCSAWGSMWEMPDSNPGPLSQKSDEPPNLHEPPLSLFTVAEVRVCVCVGGCSMCVFLRPGLWLIKWHKI